jgi:hypothetical protein
MTTTMPDIAVDAGEGPVTTRRSAPAVDRRSVYLGLAAAFCAAVALVWIGAGVRSADRGLNFADESFYLLSYRWWDVNFRNFTGAQYLYGPVFELLGHNIAHLRLFRILTLVAGHLVFGWSFMWWLRTYRPAAAPTRLWEVSGTAAILAAGGVACGWLPLTAGYNDQAVLGALLSMAVVLFAAGHRDRGRQIPLRLAFGYGAMVPMMLLVKWGSVTAIALTAVTAVVVVVLARRPVREVVRLLGALAAGAVIVVAVLFTIVPIAAVGEMIEVNRLVMTSGVRSPAQTIELYLTECYRVVSVVLDRYALLLLAAAVAVAVRWLPMLRLPAAVLAVVALGLSIQDVRASGGVHGGAGFTSGYVRTLVVPLVVAIGVAVMVADGERVHRARWSAGRAGSEAPPAMSSIGTSGARTWLVMAALVLLPLAQAIGTTGSLMPRAIGAYAAWMAVLVAVVTGIEAASAVCRWTMAALLAATVVAAGFVAVGGLWRYPYRTYPYSTATQTITGAPAVASLRFNRVTADAFAEMRRQLRPYVEPEGRAMIGVPAAVLALGGRPVGEPWVGSADRNAAGIREACRDGQPWWGQRLPVLLYTEPVTATEMAAFRACGVTFAVDYRPLAVYRVPAEPTRTLEIQVYVPAVEFTVVPGYPPRAGTASPAGRNGD